LTLAYRVSSKALVLCLAFATVRSIQALGLRCIPVRRVPREASASPSASSAIITFRHVLVGSNTSQTILWPIRNLERYNFSGRCHRARFSASRLVRPLNLSAGQNVAFTTTFSPTSSAFSCGRQRFDASNVAGSPLTISLAGRERWGATTQSAPANFSFGRVNVWQCILATFATTLDADL